LSSEKIIIILRTFRYLKFSREHNFQVFVYVIFWFFYGATCKLAEREDKERLRRRHLILKLFHGPPNTLLTNVILHPSMHNARTLCDFLMYCISLFNAFSLFNIYTHCGSIFHPLMCASCCVCLMIYNNASVCRSTFTKCTLWFCLLFSLPRHLNVTNQRVKKR